MVVRTRTTEEVVGELAELGAEGEACCFEEVHHLVGTPGLVLQPSVNRPARILSKRLV